MRALAVFGGQGVGIARLCRSGFRHCFCALEASPGAWVVLNGQIGRPLVSLCGDPEGGLAAFYEAEGYAVVEWSAPDEIEPGERDWPLVTLATCVTMVKRLLGIRAAFVVTPWQLWKWMDKRCDMKAISAASRPAITAAD